MNYVDNCKLRKIIDRNIESVEYEGDTIDIPNLEKELEPFIDDIIIGYMKGLIKWIIKNNIVVVEDKGYKYKNKYYSREELFNQFKLESNIY